MLVWVRIQIVRFRFRVSIESVLPKDLSNNHLINWPYSLLHGPPLHPWKEYSCPKTNLPAESWPASACCKITSNLRHLTTNSPTHSQGHWAGWYLTYSASQNQLTRDASFLFGEDKQGLGTWTCLGTSFRSIWSVTSCSRGS